MENYNQELFHHLINLDTFSRISANTYIHLSKTGYFVPTAGKLSGILGAQTISNYWNGYTVEQLVIDINQFASTFIDLLYNMCYYAKSFTDNKLEVKNKIKFIHKQYNYAYGDDNRGLLCLLKTVPTINDSINYIIDNLKIIKKLVKEWNIKTDIVVEYTFTDKDWELYIHNSIQLQYETIGLYKYYVMYYSSFVFNQLMNTVGLYNWFDRIYTTNGTSIYLGAMPIKSTVLGIETRNDATLLESLHINAVLSVVECYENHSNGIIYSPLLPEEFMLHNIKFLQIPIPDFCDISISKIDTCIAYIYWNISNDRNIYISCRAGKCRSNLLIMCYLIKYHGFTSDNVYEYVRSIRPQVQNKHHKTLLLYEASLNKI